MARDGLPQKALIRVAALLDRRWHWYRLPGPLAVLTLIGNRMALRRQNLFDPTGDLAEWGPEPHVADRSLVRSFDGFGTDPRHPPMGSAGSVFGRNVRPESTYPQDVNHPNPRVVSNELLARGDHFEPATSLNLLFAAWIQFEIHDWMSHHTREIDDEPWQIKPPEGDREVWPDGVIKFRRTHQVHSQVGRPPTYRNTQSHWWDGSQLYGSHPAIERLLRTYERGHLKLSPEQTFPFDPPNMKDIPPDVARDVDLPGVAGAWWVGLALFHTLFMREHNRICDMLAKKHPEWTDQHLFDTARLINVALMAKVHTLEWTPALLANPVLETGMRVNWWGFQGESLWRKFNRLTSSEELSGIPGSELYYHGAPYSITEEFVAVYRMHPLLPDDLEVRSAADGGHLANFELPEMSGVDAHKVLDDKNISMSDLFYSFATSNPGAIVLHNYPEALRKVAQPGGPDIDLATVDIVRARERGVPRYNEFRRQFHLRPAERFEDFSGDPGTVQKLRSIYDTPDDVDLMVGLYAEKPPPGFAISDTAFRVFVLMASRRLKSDRFFTYDYRPEVYTREGIRWIEDNSLTTLLRHHYPQLRKALRGVENPFKPWDSARTVPVAVASTSPHVSVGYRVRRAFWNTLITVKYLAVKPFVVPPPVPDAPPIEAVTFEDKYRRIPIGGLTVADAAPADEVQPFVLPFCWFQSWLARNVPPMQPGLPSVDPDPRRALADAYPRAYESRYRKPVRPAEYEPLDLGRLAVASPYACYLEKDAGGSGFVWDLSRLRNFEVHPGLHRPWARVKFASDPTRPRLNAVSVECELGTIKPGYPDWPAAQRLAMCALSNDVTLVRHFNWLHLVCIGPLAIATHNHLPSSHPVRRLLHPHVWLTHFSNEIVTIVQMEPGGDFESMFSFTHNGMCDLFEDTIASFDLQRFNPELDARVRRIDHLKNDVEMPALDNRLELMGIIRAHVDRYLALYYSNATIAQDAALAQWYEQLVSAMPKGVTEIAGAPLTLSGVAALLATFIYTTTVEHEIIDSQVWDYQLWSDVQPARVYQDGRRQPLDVYQRLVDFNFILNVPRTSLMSDFSPLALDERGADAFRTFRHDLARLQRKMDNVPGAPWRLEPRNLKANINY